MDGKRIDRDKSKQFTLAITAEIEGALSRDYKELILKIKYKINEDDVENIYIGALKQKL